jgi:Tfp pilus assembly protein PilX
MTRGVLRTAAISSSPLSPAQSPAQSGATLITCALMMFGVAMLTSAALRSLEDGISLTHNTVDRGLAQEAADTALHDAAMTLAMTPHQRTVAEVEGAHRIGEITGLSYAYGGYLQPGAPPTYVVEMISQSGTVNHSPAGSTPPDIYRVTAYGQGRSDSTRIILQADFAVQLCKSDSDALQNPVQEPEQGAEQNEGKSTGQSTAQSAAQKTLHNPGHGAAQSSGRSAAQSAGEDADLQRAVCVPGVRRLAWRMLQSN